MTRTCGGFDSATVGQTDYKITTVNSAGDVDSTSGKDNQSWPAPCGEALLVGGCSSLPAFVPQRIGWLGTKLALGKGDDGELRPVKCGVGQPTNSDTTTLSHLILSAG